MHAHHQHLLVVGAVEDADLAALRQRLGGAPEEIVLEFFRARLLEGMHVDALRIEARHHVLDDAVLAGGVHRLQHDQHRPGAAGVKPLLQIGKPRDALGEHRLGFGLVDGEAAAVGGVVVRQLELVRLVDAVAAGRGFRASWLLTPRQAMRAWQVFSQDLSLSASGGRERRGRSRAFSGRNRAGPRAMRMSASSARASRARCASARSRSSSAVWRGAEHLDSAISEPSTTVVHPGSASNSAAASPVSSSISRRTLKSRSTLPSTMSLGSGVPQGK